MCTSCTSCVKFKDLEEFIKKQDNKEAALIAVLHKAQELYGYLSEEVQDFVARKLEVPKSKVYGVVSFYSYFTTEPKGKYVISVCTGTACFVRGANDVLSEFKEKLGIKEGETTEDGLFTLDVLRCVGACSIAPVVLVNDEVYGYFNKSQVKTVLDEFKERK
ncbi:NADH-quinone oxidoreductase subunit NuoE [Hathewaya histolytica]|uniref:Putative Fe] hydrogenase, electron-transfer subunit n=1 Tax=Hathewaya histolytica TaxID=1498 RepID=A0A4U9R358_HATHI|nr:NADH-quinone oxidoreductase subunit NuoE [Hathewaya histolytica]VTQ85489.1 putative Fe] hydrogenase, electron-transfer subunit [Hathewaya histolytica]